jgi:hypothetical protein
MGNEQGAKSANQAKTSKDHAAAGGRSERQAQQREGEQAKAGHDKSAEVPREAVRNVKSEPHWDPTEAPAKRGAKDGGSPE